MPKVTFIAPDGARFEADVAAGLTVMEASRKTTVPGIDAECGGACACATCHVYVDEAWAEKAGKPGPMEMDMLDYASGRKANSRLSCQIKLTGDLDGIVVHVPARQG